MSFLDLPAELVAKIGLFDVQTWSRILFVFPFLSAEYYARLAKSKFLCVKKRKNGRWTTVGGQLHTIDGKPSFLALRPLDETIHESNEVQHLCENLPPLRAELLNGSLPASPRALADYWREFDSVALSGQWQLYCFWHDRGENIGRAIISMEKLERFARQQEERGRYLAEKKLSIRVVSEKKNKFESIALGTLVYASTDEELWCEYESSSQATRFRIDLSMFRKK